MLKLSQWLEMMGEFIQNPYVKASYQKIDKDLLDHFAVLFVEPKGYCGLVMSTEPIVLAGIDLKTHNIQPWLQQSQFAAVAESHGVEVQELAQCMALIESQLLLMFTTRDLQEMAGVHELEADPTAVDMDLFDWDEITQFVNGGGSE